MGNKDETVHCPNCLAEQTRDNLYCSKCGTRIGEEKDTLTYSSAQQEYIERIVYSAGDSFGDRYRIIEEIGRGGMGIVYKAEDKELGIKVALKMIRPEHSKSPRFIERFKKETLLARSISHENVIRIHDIGELNEIKYISMEYIKGQNLKELIQTSGSLSIETTINISKQISKALKAAHQKGIIHRDLKPQNIMVDSGGDVHAMDFGVAKTFDDFETSLSKGITGTPPYLSPERAKGEKSDPRSDIYSLGIIMFEMLTGKRPFEAETMEGYLHKHIYLEPPSPSMLNPQIPAFLERIILKCLEKDKEKRYQSADEILKDLETPKFETERILTRKRNKRWIYAALLSAIVLVIVFGIYFLIERKKPEITPPLETGKISVAVMLFENLSGDERLVNWPREIQVLLGMDLSQSKYLRVLPDDRLFQILKDLDQSESTKYSSDTLDRIASEENVEYFILGSLGSSGDEIRITFSIRRSRTDNVMDTDMVRGKGIGSFNSMIDDLTTSIRSKFLTSHEISMDIDRDIENITTKSPEARTLYIQGKMCYQMKDFEKSIELLKKAIEYDPEFAMAHVLIASNYGDLGYPRERNKYHQLALELVDRVSDRERYLIQGHYFYVIERNYEKAINIYQELLNLYPDDEDAYLMLGAIYFNLEEWDRSLEWYNKVLEANSKSERAWINIAYILMAKGWYDQARNNLLVNKDNFSSKAYFHRNMSHSYLYQGQYRLALQEVENAIALDPDDYRNISLKANINHLKGDLISAKKFYMKLLEAESPEIRANGHLWMARLYLLLGQYDKCKDEIMIGLTHAHEYNLEHKSTFLALLAYLNLRWNRLTNALDATNKAVESAREEGNVDDQKWALHLRGFAFLKMNKVDEAEKTAEQLEQLISETWNKKHMRHYYHLMGAIALETTQPDRSIENFNKAISLLPSQVYGYGDHSFYIDSLASAYYQIGDTDEATKQYERIASMTWGRILYGDIYARSFYWLGKLYQEKGLIDNASKQYKIFLNLWKDGDPSHREIADAKKQLAVLNE
jgi:serine/threonine protein kinase/Flp pilus assembly protein TadD